jgi:hypothetical protein
MHTQYSLHGVARIGLAFTQASTTDGPIYWQEFTFYGRDGQPVGRVVAHLEGPNAALTIVPAGSMPPRQ